MGFDTTFISFLILLNNTIVNWIKKYLSILVIILDIGHKAHHIYSRVVIV